ncbi:MAG TPA: hypothetical protein VF812_09735 [Ktedonobacterales bacterium]
MPPAGATAPSHSGSAPIVPGHTAPQLPAQAQSGEFYPPTVPDMPAYSAWQPAGVRSEPAPARMPKARALDVTRKLKAALIAGSVMALGALTALAAGHVTGVTAQAANGSNTSSSSSSSSSTFPSNTNRGDDGGFFNQAPSNSSGAQGGFGVSPSAPSQQPISGTTVS